LVLFTRPQVLTRGQTCGNHGSQRPTTAASVCQMFLLVNIHVDKCGSLCWCFRRPSTSYHTSQAKVY